MPALRFSASCTRQRSCCNVLISVQRRVRVRLRHQEAGAVHGRNSRCHSSSSQVSSWDQGRFSTIGEQLTSFYKFTRPHTMLGTLLSVCSVSLMAMRGQSWGAEAWAALTMALVSALLANVSIVGLNQCFDIEMDRVNKPYLPLASGEWSPATGWTVVIITGALALAAALASTSWPLALTVGVSILLGVVYSADVPFLRWKKYPLAAAACILAVRAILVQLGFWSHMVLAAGTPTASLQLDTRIGFMTAFMAFFSIVIALFKDIPDVRGDAMHDTPTASVRFGVRRVFWTCICLLHVAYAAALVYIGSTMTGAARVVALAVQLALAALLQSRMVAVDLSKHSEIVSAYMFVWKLFYAQYLVFPFLG